MTSRTPPSAPIWERSSLVRAFRWLFSGRILRRIALGTAWFAALIALAYGVENWRGRRAWNQYQAQLEARGTPVDLASLIPKPIPDDRNLASTPLVLSWFDRSTNGGTRWRDDYDLASPQEQTPKEARGLWRPMDLAQWVWALQIAATNRAKSPTHPRRRIPDADESTLKAAFPSRSAAAAAVLEGLRSSEAPLEELRDAARRPDSRFPVVYNLDDPWGILLPHLSGLKGACMRLQLRACASLAAGDSAKALEDVLLSLALADSLKNEPFIISFLVRMACVRAAIQPVWEGLSDGRWSDAQLQTLQQRLSGYHFLAEMNRGMESERAAAIRSADLMAQGKYRFSQLDDDSSGGPPRFWEDGFRELAGVAAPRGWFQWEKVNYCRLLDRQLSGAYDVTANRVAPSRVAANAAALEGEISSGQVGKGLSGILRHQFLASLLLPNRRELELPYKAAAAQTAVNQALLACALERYRVARGAFPETLSALVPTFLTPLPNDLITGEPYPYRRTADGSFLLYSIGWNETDDGGVAGALPFSKAEGDWVWEYPRR